MISWEQLRVPPLGGTRALLEHHRVERRGVVHVGAHRGEELEVYLGCGFERILYLEPNPLVYVDLERHLAFWRDWLGVLQQSYGLARIPSLESRCLAIADRPGSRLFHLTECTGQSSLLQPGAGIHKQAEMEVAVTNLDTLLAERLEEFSLLTVDAQGAELLVLQGAKELLSRLDMVVVEVSFRPRYQGGPSPEQLDVLLEAAGFRAVVRAQASPWAQGGNVAYARRRA